jgi:hypothetical protein
MQSGICALIMSAFIKSWVSLHPQTSGRQGLLRGRMCAALRLSCGNVRVSHRRLRRAYVKSKSSGHIVRRCCRWLVGRTNRPGGWIRTHRRSRYRHYRRVHWRLVAASNRNPSGYRHCLGDPQCCYWRRLAFACGEACARSLWRRLGRRLGQAPMVEGPGKKVSPTHVSGGLRSWKTELGTFKLTSAFEA